MLVLKAWKGHGEQLNLSTVWSGLELLKRTQKKAIKEKAAQLQKEPQKFWKYQCRIMTDPQEQQPQ